MWDTHRRLRISDSTVGFPLRAGRRQYLHVVSLGNRTTEATKISETGGPRGGQSGLQNAIHHRTQPAHQPSRGPGCYTREKRHVTAPHSASQDIESPVAPRNKSVSHTHSLADQLSRLTPAMAKDRPTPGGVKLRNQRPPGQFLGKAGSFSRGAKTSLNI